MSQTPPSFGPELFDFLRQLRQNNRREWFAANKERYEEHVKHPALQFISDFGPRLHGISTQFVADPRPVGGSLFRIHRDVRFSPDKSPYKTSVGIQFRHKRHKDVHSPGFYLHLEPDGSFLGVGIWRPDGETLRQIRNRLAENPKSWQSTVGEKRFRRHFELGGDTLQRPPRGFDAEHPLIEDLKRKDFFASTPFTDDAVTAPGFLAEFERLSHTGAPLVRYLCDATDLSF